MPASLGEMRSWIGWRVDDVNGSGLGRLLEVIGDGGAPAWLVISEFRFGDGRRFWAPAAEATGARGRVWVPFEAGLVRGTATLGAHRHSPQAERRLRLHYGLAGAARTPKAG
jgi:hypothetical protein